MSDPNDIPNDDGDMPQDDDGDMPQDDMISMRPILERLNNTQIRDTMPPSYINRQGKPFITLAVIDQNTLSSAQYQNLNTSYHANQLAFTEWGSLADSEAINNTAYQFFSSPFDPLHYDDPPYNITRPRAGDEINGLETASVYGTIANFSSKAGALFKPGETFVSPRTAKWILNVTQGGSGKSNIFTIYFNPLNNPNLTLPDIETNISRYCNMINNVDPMCFCQEAEEICTEAVFPDRQSAAKLKADFPDKYAEIKSQCSCLNSQCQFASENENNEYARIKTCPNGGTACGSQFTFSMVSGMSNDINESIVDKCGAGGIAPSTAQKKAEQEAAARKKAEDAKKAEAAKKLEETEGDVLKQIGVAIGIVVFFGVMYYLLTHKRQQEDE